MIPSKEQLVAILDGDAHEWINKRLYELGRIRFNDKHTSIIGVDEVEFDGTMVVGRAYYNGGDCYPTKGHVRASVDDLLSAESAHASWTEEMRVAAEKEALRVAKFERKMADQRTLSELAQLKKLKEKYE